MNTDQAFKKLKSAGVTDSIQTVRRWLREGKIKAKRTENRKAGYIIENDDLQRFINERTGRDKDKRIKELEYKIKQKERGVLAKENHKLQLEVDRLRQENLNLKMKSMKQTIDENRNTSNSHSFFSDMSDEDLRQYRQKLFGQDLILPSKNYREELGLSSGVTNQEVVKEFKKLLRILHPDTGGNAKLFQRVKEDYDDFIKTTKS
ncbi:hypothetical protein [Bacillus marinisedimentorum]|uniref:hypothetical protein n=1 Tax=Bacillus marinisedimentorum TaxID=1821260 RepID=UPI0007DE6487|nr:hypothetical protein [Bacillus marinisedimentorum]